MKLLLFLYLKPILCKLDLKNDFFDISKLCLPMIIWTFFQTAEDISRYKKLYLPNVLRPTSFSYLDSYCEVHLAIHLNLIIALIISRPLHSFFQIIHVLFFNATLSLDTGLSDWMEFNFPRVYINSFRCFIVLF